MENPYHFTQTQPLTQELTQEQFDPRRRSRHSGLSLTDASDVFCTLHPGSLAALSIVRHTAERKPQHILQNQPLENNSWIGDIEGEGYDDDGDGSEKVHRAVVRPQDLALRFSSEVVDPIVGFLFGRHATLSDINLDAENKQKRVSNRHFRIYINENGILMLEDLSSNGTIVDNMTVGGSKRKGNNPTTYMLRSGAVIEILSDTPDDMIKFVLLIPQRPGCEDEYHVNFQQYMEFQALATQRKRLGVAMPVGGARKVMIEQNFRPSKTRATLNPPGVQSNYGMKWAGGEEFACIGEIGKGAFATVYQIATRLHGELFAAKELEKKRFIKNGVLDERLNNELQIMKHLRHAHVVDYIDYVETDTHLYIIMEYVRYGDLQGYVKPDASGQIRTLTEDLGKTVASQILTALAYLHDMNVTHRDIKPDNILISSHDPFIVKLTDFGLSKMAKDPDTFLRTFCGTLLYCAPEVFPFYETSVPRKCSKRCRTDPSPRRSYSQLVDVYSFAAVLWYCLCGKPPFEGTTDENGRAMFNRIMYDHLDESPLKEKGLTEACIDLLLIMLNTNPSYRPTELECLAHPWLHDSAARSCQKNTLAMIHENDGELDCSQLTLQDQLSVQAAGGLKNGEKSFESALREKKRHKGKTFFFAPGTIDAEVLREVDVRTQSAGGMDGVIDEPQPNGGQPPAPSWLRSSGVFGSSMVSAPRESSTSESISNDRMEEMNTSLDETEQLVDSEHEPTALNRKLHPLRPFNTPNQKLDSMVQDVEDLQMASPTAISSANHEGILKHVVPKESLRPKASLAHQQTAINRRINLPVSPSFYYDPSDPSTHNLEYATRVSGFNFLIGSAAQVQLGKSLPDGERTTGPDKENEGIVSQMSPPLSIPSFPIPAADFVKPLAVLGKFTSTSSSFVSLTLNLTQRFTTWGRHPKNTLVFSNSQDTRIPKVALEIWFHAPGIEELERARGDWTRMEELQVIVSTQSSHGIWVNGVKMEEKDKKGMKCYGKLYTGDEVRVSSPSDGNGLRFRCEFLVGKSSKRRRDGAPRFVVEAD